MRGRWPVCRQHLSFTILCHTIMSYIPRLRGDDDRAAYPGVDRRLGNQLLRSPGPVDRPRGWHGLVNQPMEKSERDRLVVSLERSRPLGEERWVEKIAKQMGVEHTLRPTGQPKKQETT